MKVKWKGLWKISVFGQSRFISKTVQDTAIVTMEDEQELVSNPLNGAIFYDLCSTSNNSKTMQE